MIRERFKFQWSTQVRADVARDLELVRLMKKAGCHTLFIGFESVNPGSLDAMKKKQTVEDISRARPDPAPPSDPDPRHVRPGVRRRRLASVKKTVQFASAKPGWPRPSS